MKEIKSNTKLFNELIEKQVANGDLKDIDIDKYKDSDMEECDGGYGTADIKNMIKNKELGGKRTSPQEVPEVKKYPKVFTCPQCDFISQNEPTFNNHVTSAHAGQPTCPFCFLGFNDYQSLRKHCQTKHKEVRNQREKEDRNLPEGRKRPCRFFRNGEGQCSQRSGFCNYDHTVVPENE